ncbi:hypothetical protein Tco_0666019 [Tanacetum coccineum]
MVFPPTRLVLALEIEPFVEVGSMAGFMIDTVHEPRYSHALWCPTNMHAFCFESFHEIFCRLFIPLLNMMDLHGELVKPDPGGANEREIEHVAPVSAMIMIIFREVKLFSPSRQPATCAVSGISFFFNFSMAFTVARNVALDEIPGVLPSSMWIFCCPAQASAPSFTSVSVLWCDVCPSRECTLLFLSPNRAKTFLSLGPSLVNIVAFTGLLRRVDLLLHALV